MGKFGLVVVIGENYSMIRLEEQDNHEYTYSFHLNYVYRFTYQNNKKNKPAELHISWGFNESSNQSDEQETDVTLVVDDEYDKIRIDDANHKIVSVNTNTYNNELELVSDLQQKIIQIYKEASRNLMPMQSGKQIIASIVERIQATSPLSSADTSGFKHIEDISFDHIYSLFNSDGGHNQWEIVENYFIIEKNGKYGLVNNHGLVVVDMIQDYYISLINGQEFYWYSAYLDEIPFTVYKFGGSHGLGGKHLYFDLERNYAMGMGYGDDGPGVYYYFEKRGYENFPVLPFTSVDSCNYSKDGSCVVINPSTLLGLMSNQGIPLTDPMYENVFLTKTPLVAVKKNGYWGYINERVEEVIDCIYQGIVQTKQELYPYPPTNGYVVVKNKNNLFGVVDLTGEVLVPFDYEMISQYYDNQIILKKNGTWTTKTISW